jgi:hypothetical protein
VQIVELSEPFILVFRPDEVTWISEEYSLSEYVPGLSIQTVDMDLELLVHVCKVDNLWYGKVD